MTTSGTSDESSDDENSDKKSSEDSEDSSDESSDGTSNATDPLEDLIAAPSQSSSSFQARMTIFISAKAMESLALLQQLFSIFKWSFNHSADPGRHAIWADRVRSFREFRV